MAGLAGVSIQSTFSWDLLAASSGGQCRKMKTCKQIFFGPPSRNFRYFYLVTLEMLSPRLLNFPCFDKSNAFHHSSLSLYCLLSIMSCQQLGTATRKNNKSTFLLLPTSPPSFCPFFWFFSDFCFLLSSLFFFLFSPPTLLKKKKHENENENENLTWRRNP